LPPHLSSVRAIPGSCISSVLFIATRGSVFHCSTPGPVRWGYVFSNFAQVVACLFYTYYIFERFCVPVFRNFNEEYWSPRRLILSMFGSMLPGTLVLFIGRCSFCP
jgi:hypothetical protein